MAINDVFIVSGQQTKYLSFGSPPVLSTTTNQASNAAAKTSPYTSFQAIVTGTGTVTATVTIQVSNEDATASATNANWCATALGTITLNGASPQTDGFTTTAPWKYVRANVTNVTGTNATVQILMGN